MSDIKYVIAKSKTEAVGLPGFDNMRVAQNSILESGEKNEKWYCFAKFKKDDVMKYAVIAYYDCISPTGETSDNMRWYDFMKYKNDPHAVQKFKKLRVG